MSAENDLLKALVDDIVLGHGSGTDTGRAQSNKRVADVINDLDHDTAIHMLVLAIGWISSLVTEEGLHS